MASETKTPPNGNLTEGFKTTDGTIYVSKPFRSKNSKKLRALITFKPRSSAFDTTNESSGTNEFRVSILAFIKSLSLLTPESGILHPLLDIHVSIHRPDIYH
jgi:sterol O-acyltransferase